MKSKTGDASKVLEKLAIGTPTILQKMEG